MSTDLRALAARLDMLKPCRIQEGYFDDSNIHRVGGDRCDACDGTGRRLPTEAEVRAAIREAGHFWVEVGTNSAFASVTFGGDVGPRAIATASEAVPDDLVLLALLRALEACRG